MQQADETTGASRSARFTAPSPVVVFLGLMIVLVALGAAVLLTRDAPTPPPTAPTTTEPDFSLTDAEAIARFKELNNLLLIAYRDRDFSLIDSFLSANSPLRGRAEKEIQQLIDDHVLDRARVKSLSTKVIRNTGDSITVRHKSVEYPHFLSEAGEDVSSTRRPLLQVVDWTLHLESSVWKLYDSNVVRNSTYEGGGK